jgi:hypothetical protein
MASVGTVRIDVDSSDVDTAAKKIDGLASTLKKMAATSIAEIVSLGGAFAALTLTIANQIDDLNDLAEMYGYSVTQVSIMKRAVEAAGGSFDDLAKANNKARLELSKGGEAYKNLGVAFRGTNGELKTGEELKTNIFPLELQML